MLWVRGNLFIPDARKYWVKPSVAYLTDIIKKEQIDTVITTGPPHSVHLIGLKLQQTQQVKWLADFRDPWTSIGYHKKLRLNKRAQKKHKYLERLVLNKADSIIVTSETTKKEFQEITQKPIAVITNGYDIGGYKGWVHMDERFTISHIGSLLSGRNPINLWKVLSEIARENSVFRADLRLKFMGVVSQEVIQSLTQYELTPNMKLIGYGAHSEALMLQNRSQILLLVEINSEETRGIIPGKLFEYMAAKRPILAIGPKNWEAGEIIENSKSGEVFDYEAHKALKKLILKWYTAFKNKELTIDSQEIEKYSRKALTKQLVEQL